MSIGRDPNGIFLSPSGAACGSARPGYAAPLGLEDINGRTFATDMSLL